MVLDLEWFYGNRTKFEDWWKGIQLFLKSNKGMEIDDRITTILAFLRKGVVGIYTQKKLVSDAIHTRSKSLQDGFGEV